MPLCEVCNTYYSHKPCPNCQPKQKISNEFHSDKYQSKNFILAPGRNELDFIWAQVCKSTIQRVQSGGQILRQGFFNIQLPELDINFEWIGSTFTQGFYGRLEKLYPGTEAIIILSDIIAQNFNVNSLTDILNDLINVNKRSLKKIFIVWLEPYINSLNDYQRYKNDVKTSVTNYFSQRNINLPFKEYSFPLFSSSRFAKELQSLLCEIVEISNLQEYLEKKLPLRPLFRTNSPILDPKAPNRVIILDLEKSASFEPIKKIKINLNEQFESQKCLACSSEIADSFKTCLVCNFAFCNDCINYLRRESDSSEEFCLGSIYHGLHRASFI